MIAALPTASTRPDLIELAGRATLGELMDRAGALRDAGHGNLLTYSPKVFIPLTQLCRDVCHYCTFAKTPKRIESPYLSLEQVLDIARAGAARGCKEALFTLGDKPELRYPAARRALERLGYPSTLAYLEAAAEFVLRETGLLPHLNPGVLDAADYARLRRVAPSMGLMLESASERLCRRGGPHFGSPDKQPALRLESLRAAGRMRVPTTTGILVGIGETRAERLESLLVLRELHETHHHIQEIIVQNFLPKPDTPMASTPPADFDELLWSVAMARLVFGPAMSIQVPPNLNAGRLAALIEAGINDWGGISPVTADHVNPEAPWPEVEVLERSAAAAGKTLAPRLTVYPRFIAGRHHRHNDRHKNGKNGQNEDGRNKDGQNDRHKWIDAGLDRYVLRLADAEGLARTDTWAPGQAVPPPAVSGRATHILDGQTRTLERLLDRAADGVRLDTKAITKLFAARGPAVQQVTAAADRLRRAVCGDTVSYVVNRNINYTNLCIYKCSFCAFSKGKTSAALRGTPYLVSLEEVARRAREAWDRGATEVCMQGGIHPGFTGDTYLSICRAAKRSVPDIHVHAFSPLEVKHGADTLGLPVPEYLARLEDAGLSTLPGTAAEILDDDLRRVLCPDKLSSTEWLAVVEQAHLAGLRTTATMMFGHIDTPVHWARHLLAIRDLQQKTGGFTEFVPLPFVPMEAPLYRRGLARPGPTFRETLLVHAVARLVLHPLIPNIQASWPKLGEVGLLRCLSAGVNDLGGTLMNESISKAAGAAHGQELPPAAMERLIRRAGRQPRQRTTLYGNPPARRRTASLAAAALAAPAFEHPRSFDVEAMSRSRP